MKKYTRNRVICLEKIPEFTPSDQYLYYDPDWVAHIYCSGARFHVLSWGTFGTRCSHPNCIVNKIYEENKKNNLPLAKKGVIERVDG